MGKEGNLDWAPVLSFVKRELNKFPSFLPCLKDFVCKDPSVANTSCSGVTQKKVQALGLRSHSFKGSGLFMKLFKFFYLFTYFILGLHWAFAAARGLTPVSEQELLSSTHAWTFYCAGFPGCRAQALGPGLQ